MYINSPYSITDIGNMTARLIPSFIFRATYVAENQLQHYPILKRFAQVAEVKFALSFTEKAIHFIHPSFSFGSKAPMICLAIGIIPKIFGKALNNLPKPIRQGWQKLDEQWDTIAIGARILSVAAAAGLIACGEASCGFSILGCMGIGFLETKKIVPIRLSQVMTIVNLALNAATIGSLFLTGSFYLQLILTVGIADQVINFIGHKYYPIYTPITEADEKNLVQTIRALTSSQEITSPSKTTISQDYLKWRAIPRFFTLTYPTMPSPYRLMSWLRDFKIEENQDPESKVLRFKVRAKTRFLIDLQREIEKRCEKIYFRERNQPLFGSGSPQPDPLEKNCLEETFHGVFKPLNDSDCIGDIKMQYQPRENYFDVAIETIIQSDENDDQFLNELWKQFEKHLYPINDPVSVRFEDHVNELKELENIRSILAKEITTLLAGDEEVSFQEAIDTGGFNFKFIDTLEQSVQELRTTYQEFRAKHSFECKTESQTFINLSILGILQQTRQKRIYDAIKETGSTLSIDEKMVSDTTNFILSNALGLPSNAPTFVLLTNYSLCSLIAMLFKKGESKCDVVSPVMQFCSTLPSQFTSDKTNSELARKFLRDLQIPIIEFTSV